MDRAEHLLNSFCTLMNSFRRRSLEKLVDAMLGRNMKPASGPDESKERREIFRFEDFELDRYQLHRAGHPVRLQRLPLELLYLLVERRGELLTREEIIERLWARASSSTARTASTRQCARSAGRSMMMPMRPGLSSPYPPGATASSLRFARWPALPRYPSRPPSRQSPRRAQLRTPSARAPLRSQRRTRLFERIGGEGFR